MHLRETINEAGYVLIAGSGEAPNRTLILGDENGKLELWQESPGFAGYAVRALDSEFEFVRMAVQT